MTVTAIKIMFVLGILGHALNMYCDRILSIFPNGTIKFDNIAEIKKDGVLAKMMEGVSPEVPLRSAVLGVFALVLEFTLMKNHRYLVRLCLSQPPFSALLVLVFMSKPHWQSMYF